MSSFEERTATAEHLFQRYHEVCFPTIVDFPPKLKEAFFRRIGPNEKFEQEGPHEAWLLRDWEMKKMAHFTYPTTAKEREEVQTAREAVANVRAIRMDVSMDCEMQKFFNVTVQEFLALEGLQDLRAACRVLKEDEMPKMAADFRISVDMLLLKDETEASEWHQFRELETDAQREFQRTVKENAKTKPHQHSEYVKWMEKLKRTEIQKREDKAHRTRQREAVGRGRVRLMDRAVNSTIKEINNVTDAELANFEELRKLYKKIGYYVIQQMAAEHGVMPELLILNNRHIVKPILLHEVEASMQSAIHGKSNRFAEARQMGRDRMQ